MGSDQTPSRFASSLPTRPPVEPPVEDFAMISLESVEKMLGDTGLGTGTTPGTAPASGVPPPLFDPTAPPGARPTPMTPPLPIPASPAMAGGSRFRFADLLRPDGTVDTEAVYRFGKVPEVKLSAELILQALAKLPPDIPELARHAAIQITVTSLTQAAGIPPETVVDDARVRYTRLAQFQEALRGEIERDKQPLRQAAEELKAVIAARQSELQAVYAQLKEREDKAASTQRDCEAKLSALQEVIDLMEAKTPA